MTRVGVGTAVYVDTSALLPLIDDEDQDHGAVVEAVSRLAEDDVGLVTTSYTLVEAGALIRPRLGVEAFQRLGQVAAAAAEIVWVDAELHHRAWQQTGRGPRRGPSFVDVVGFLVMEDHGLTTALAIDRHFRDRGFELLPG